MQLKINNDIDRSFLFNSILKKEWDKVRLILQENPRDAKKVQKKSVSLRKKTHMLPLHEAVSQMPSVQAIGCLLSVYPRSAQIPETHMNRLPLHLACQKGASVEVLKLLLTAYPEAIQREAAKGKLPLHYACSVSAPCEVVNLLLSYLPEAVLHRDEYGCIPLHYACARQTDPSVIRTLVRYYPESVLVKSHRGQSPLDLTSKIVKSGIDLESIEFLEEHQEQCKKKQSESKQLASDDKMFYNSENLMIARVLKSAGCGNELL